MIQMSEAPTRWCLCLVVPRTWTTRSDLLRQPRIITRWRKGTSSARGESTKPAQNASRTTSVAWMRTWGLSRLGNTRARSPPTGKKPPCKSTLALQNLHQQWHQINLRDYNSIKTRRSTMLRQENAVVKLEMRPVSLVQNNNRSNTMDGDRLSYTRRTRRNTGESRLVGLCTHKQKRFRSKGLITWKTRLNVVLQASRISGKSMLSRSW
mmetsp:Transcript_28986/g.67152  ORF Transcript_28986/g.67152 Transcript_28986/m.67152 type:complete len:209 (+) Transcript_28986:1199-1825(+)